MGVDLDRRMPIELLSSMLEVCSRKALVEPPLYSQERGRLRNDGNEWAIRAGFWGQLAVVK